MILINLNKNKPNIIKKRISFSLLFSFCILFFSGCKTRQSNNSEEAKLREQIQKYHISKVTEMITFYHVGNPEKERINHIDHFDKNGLKIKSQTFADDGIIERNMENQFDEEGNLLVSIGTNATGQFIYKETRSYDREGNRLELYFYLPDGTYKYRNVATSDSEGKMTELNWYWTTGFKARNKFTYLNGNLAEDSEYGPDSTLYYVWKYKYDKRNNKIEAVQYSSDSIVNIKITYDYNVDQLLVRQTEYFGESVRSVFSFEYDKKNLLTVKTKHSATGSVLIRYKYFYGYY